MQIFDSHFHIINPDYPLIANNGYLPSPFTVEEYRNQTKQLNIAGGAIVSGSFQAFDQEYLKDALKKSGENYVGVANIPIDISDESFVFIFMV